MSTTHPDQQANSVTFTDLSRNPKAVAEKTAALGEVRVTHRDSEDFVLTTAARAELREANLSTASRLFLALMKQDPAARTLLLALPEVFPWVHHLDDEEVREFTVELLQALSDAAELGQEAAVNRVITSWRATARIYADPVQRAAALEPLDGHDYGPVEVHA